MMYRIYTSNYINKRIYDLFAYAFTIDSLHLSHTRLHNTSVVWVYSYSGSRNTWQLENDEFNKAIFYGIG